MPQIFTKTQNNFGRGMVDEKLQSRVGEPIYEKGLLNCINCLIEPSSIVKKRYGTQFIYDLTSLGSTFKIIPFEYSLDFSYLLVFYPLNIAVFYNDELVATVPTTYDTEHLSNLRYAQSLSTMVLTDGTHKPQQLNRITHPNIWSITDIDFTNVPTYDFNKDYFTTDFTSSATYGECTITATTPVFHSELVNGMFIANGCFARITEYTDTTHIKVQTLDTTYFFTDDGTPGGHIYPIKGINTTIKEPAWSDTHGWPTNPCLHANRLWFGGNLARPQGIWGSVVGDYYNFDEGSGLPDDCISVNIDSQQLNSIEYLISANTLEIFTNTAVYVASQPDNTDVLTPSLTMAIQSKEGASDVTPIFIDNQVFYVQRGGKIVRNFVYDFNIRSYNSDNVSLYSSDLIRNPVDTAVLKYTDSDSANYIFFINGDGTMATFQSEAAEDVKAWTLIRTDGEYIRGSAMNDQAYFIVKRTIDSETKYYLEKIDQTIYMDSWILKTYVSPTNTITGLDYLEGKQVQVFRDGVLEPIKTVTNGQITTTKNGNDFYIGLQFESIITPLPASIDFYTTGRTIYLPKTIRRVFLDLFQTYGIKFNGQIVPYFQLNEYVLGSIVEGKTGIATIQYEKDWEPRQNIMITHDYPVPFTLSGIGYEITMRGL